MDPNSQKIQFWQPTIIGAYQNIPQEDGLKCLKEQLDERKNPSIPSEFITNLILNC